MATKKSNGLVEVKVLTAVLEERFKNHREHNEKILNIKFKEIKDELKKGTKKMDGMQTQIQQNTKFRERIKIIVATISTIFGAIGGIIVFVGSKIGLSRFFK